MAFDESLYSNLKVEKKYEKFLEETKEYIEKERDTLANLSNFSSLVNAFFDDLNWSGFYLLKGGELVLGPFIGMPATSRIKRENGVCGDAFTKREVLNVPMVCEYPGHITCDIRSKSELVIPLIKEGKIYGVLDLDSSVVDRFNSEDLRALKEGLDLLNANVNYNDICEGERL